MLIKRTRKMVFACFAGQFAAAFIEHSRQNNVTSQLHSGTPWGALGEICDVHSPAKLSVSVSVSVSMTICLSIVSSNIFIAVDTGPPTDIDTDTDTGTDNFFGH